MGSFYFLTVGCFPFCNSSVWMFCLAFLMILEPFIPKCKIPFSATDRRRSLVQTQVKIPERWMREHVAMRVGACRASNIHSRPKMAWRPAILTWFCEGWLICAKRVALVDLKYESGLGVGYWWSVVRVPRMSEVMRRSCNLLERWAIQVSLICVVDLRKRISTFDRRDRVGDPCFPRL